MIMKPIIEPEAVTKFREALCYYGQRRLGIGFSANGYISNAIVLKSGQIMRKHNGKVGRSFIESNIVDPDVLCVVDHMIIHRGSNVAVFITGNRDLNVERALMNFGITPVRFKDVEIEDDCEGCVDQVSKLVETVATEQKSALVSNSSGMGAIISGFQLKEKHVDSE